MRNTVMPPDIPGLVPEVLLGSGGFADVFLYQQRMPARKVAVKVLRTHEVEDWVIHSFAAEANAMAQLEHPHIVPVYSALTAADGRPCIVMTYYSRGNLNTLSRASQLSIAEVLRIGIQMCGAVETAHQAGFLHRDIKPANILLNQFRAPGLTDFGIAARVASEAKSDGAISIPWAAPELLEQTAPASVATDLYALAATVWSLAAQHAPFEIPGGDNSAQAMTDRTCRLPMPNLPRIDAPMALNQVLATGLAKDATRRHSSALQFGRALQTVERDLDLPRTTLVTAAEEQTSRARFLLDDRLEPGRSRLAPPMPSREARSPAADASGEGPGLITPSAPAIPDGQRHSAEPTRFAPAAWRSGPDSTSRQQWSGADWAAMQPSAGIGQPDATRLAEPWGESQPAFPAVRAGGHSPGGFDARTQLQPRTTTADPPSEPNRQRSLRRGWLIGSIGAVLITLAATFLGLRLFSGSTAPLALGTCLGGLRPGPQSPDELDVVPCDQAHFFEVVGVERIEDAATYPGDTALGFQGKSFCEPEYRKYTGANATRYQWHAIGPQASSWHRESARWFVCIGGSDRGGIIGTIKG